jgi:hypothetical protein
MAAGGRLGTLPSAEDVPSLAELARWSSPQPAEPIMATMRQYENSAAATVLNYRPPTVRALSRRLVFRSMSAAYPQGRFSGWVSARMGLLRNGPQAQKTRPVESAGLSSDRGVSFGPSAIGKRLFPRAKALIFVRTLKNPDSGAAFEFGSGLL